MTRNVRAGEQDAVIQFDSLVEAAARRWEQVIVGDLSDYNPGDFPGITDLFDGSFEGVGPVNEVVDDILIGYEFTTVDGPNQVLGFARPTFAVSRNGSPAPLPFAGAMTFDIDDFQNSNDEEQLLTIIIHEMGHALGIGSLWSSRCGEDCSEQNQDYECTFAQEQFQEIFGTDQTLQMSLDETASGDVACGHWKEDQFEDLWWEDVMTPGYSPGKEIILSTITVGAMADFGYTVNYAGADPIPPNPNSFSFDAGPSSYLSSNTSDHFLQSDPIDIIHEPPTSIPDTNEADQVFDDGTNEEDDSPGSETEVSPTIPGEQTDNEELPNSSKNEGTSEIKHNTIATEENQTPEQEKEAPLEQPKEEPPEDTQAESTGDDQDDSERSWWQNWQLAFVAIAVLAFASMGWVAITGHFSPHTRVSNPAHAAVKQSGPPPYLRQASVSQPHHDTMTIDSEDSRQV